MPEVEDIEFDVATLTMGELAAAEVSSGLPVSELLKSGVNQAILAVFVSRLRNSGKRPNWSELASRSLVEWQYSVSPSSPDSPSVKSSD